MPCAVGDAECCRRHKRSSQCEQPNRAEPPRPQIGYEAAACGRRGSNLALLTSIAAMQQVNCTWVCIGASLHCISSRHFWHRAQRAMVRGQEWESECKAVVQKRYTLDLHGRDAVVAGLFGGDWLPLVSAAVGSLGVVHGFEPTDAVNVSRATAAANELTNVRIAHRCLSRESTMKAFCTRDRRGVSFGDKSHIAESHTADCVTERIQCTALDQALPWQSQPVGFLLLDVEGHEEEALQGALDLTRRWLPLLASEKPLLGTRIFNQHLQGLGYRGDASCPGLHFYRTSAAGRARRAGGAGSGDG